MSNHVIHVIHVTIHIVIHVQWSLMCYIKHFQKVGWDIVGSKIAFKAGLIKSFNYVAFLEVCRKALLHVAERRRRLLLLRDEIIVGYGERGFGEKTV
jgi:hypothetical protein